MATICQSNMIKILKYSAKEDETEKLIEFYINHYTKFNPDDEPPSREDLKTSLSRSPVGLDMHRWSVEDNSEIVASGGYTQPKSTSEEFKTSGHIGQLFITVLEEHRGKGYSKHLTNQISSHAKSMGVTKFQYFARNEVAFKISEKLGAKKGPEGGENRLKLQDVNKNLIKTWIQEGKERNPDVKFHHFISTIPEEYIDRFCEIYSETLNQAPDEGVEYTTVFTPQERREQEQEYQQMEKITHVMLTEEPSGELSGVTETIYNRKYTFAIDQELTGVRSKYRGRGIGKWLKAEMIDYIMRAYPVSKIISTGNADSNAPMMSINNRLGFYPHHRNIIYEIELDKITI